MKSGIEYGAITVRNLKLSSDIKRMEQELVKLHSSYELERKITEEIHIKYKRTEKALFELHQFYENEKQQQVQQFKAKTHKDISDVVQSTKFWIDEVDRLKVENENEKMKFTELLKVLSTCYSGIAEIIEANSIFDVMYDLRQLLPA